MTANNVEIIPFSEKDQEEFQKMFESNVDKKIYVGPKRYVLSEYFKPHMDSILNMPLRPSDIFVVSYPRSGTTWTQELVWLLANDLNFEKAKSIPLAQRFPFLELCCLDLFNPEAVKHIFANAKTEEEQKLAKLSITPAYETLASTPSPRFIQSHLPLSLLPATTLDSTKVVYVARDPRDVAVSLYYFTKSIKGMGLKCNFQEFYYKLFSKNLVLWAPLFENVKEAWAMRHHPNLQFIFYEELSNDLLGTARKVASFLGKQYTEDQFLQLCEHLEFSNFQKNSSVNIPHLKKLGIIEDKQNNFVRKGKVGGWREYFDEEMSRHAESWMEEGLRGTDLRFPQEPQSKK